MLGQGVADRHHNGRDYIRFSRNTPPRRPPDGYSIGPEALSPRAAHCHAKSENKTAHRGILPPVGRMSVYQPHGLPIRNVPLPRSPTCSPAWVTGNREPGSRYRERAGSVKGNAAGRGSWSRRTRGVDKAWSRSSRQAFPHGRDARRDDSGEDQGPPAGKRESFTRRALVAVSGIRPHTAQKTGSQTTLGDEGVSKRTSQGASRISPGPPNGSRRLLARGGGPEGSKVMKETAGSPLTDDHFGAAPRTHLFGRWLGWTWRPGLWLRRWTRSFSR